MKKEIKIYATIAVTLTLMVFLVIAFELSTWFISFAVLCIVLFLGDSFLYLNFKSFILIVGLITVLPPLCFLSMMSYYYYGKIVFFEFMNAKEWVQLVGPVVIAVLALSKSKLMRSRMR